MRSFYVLAIVAGSIAAGSANAATIANGSFEANGVGAGYGAGFAPGSTGISSWTVIAHDGTTTGPNDVALLGNGAYGLDTPFGIAFVDLTGYSDAAPYAGLSQVITTIANQAYSVSFWLGASTVTSAYEGPVSVTASAAGASTTFANNGRATQTAGNTIWTQEVFNFTATGTSTTLDLVGTSATGGQFIGLDNISIADRAAAGVPEPATWAMMIAGFGLTGYVSRRRRVVVLTA